MARVLPTLTDGTPYYDFTVDLDGRTFGFEFKWNDRESTWYFNLTDADEVVILAGRKVVLGIGLLGRFRDVRLPNGELCAVDTTGADGMPGLKDLGTRVQLVYVEAAEIPEDGRV